MKRFQRILFILGSLVTACLAHAQLNPNDALPTLSKGPAGQPTAPGLQPLQGTWEGVMVGDKSQAKVVITITGNSLHFHRDTNFWFRTTITLPAGTHPAQLHATIKDCPASQSESIGKVVIAIYRIEGGTLSLATGGGGPEEAPKEFEATEDAGVSRYELRRVAPSRKDAEPRLNHRGTETQRGLETDRPTDGPRRPTRRL